MNPTGARGTPPTGSAFGISRAIILVSGLVFVLGFFLHAPWLVAKAADAARALTHRPGIATPDPERVHEMQRLFLVTGLCLVVAAWCIGRIAPLDRALRRPLVEKIVLAFFALALPLGWLELGLRAFVPPDGKSTRVFVADARLGWRLRPDAVDRRDGVAIRINGRGFRGPVLARETPARTRRVLYLGDSVTFGHRIERWQDTYPFLVDSLLAARDSLPVETLNLAVEGYSPWQEYVVLAEEGLPYSPDLVVVGFSLDDVTEIFHRGEFAGGVPGASAIVQHVTALAREIKAKRALGDDLRSGAIRQESLEVETLMREPDRADVKRAWDFALADLQEIIDLCASRGIPVLVVVFPHPVQLSDPLSLAAPQRVITAYASARQFAAVDLLLPLANHARDTGAAPADLFLDHNHLSARGHRAVAELLATAVGSRLPVAP